MTIVHRRRHQFVASRIPDTGHASGGRKSKHWMLEPSSGAHGQVRLHKDVERGDIIAEAAESPRL